MANNIWFTSDTHFSHQGSLRWMRDSTLNQNAGRVRPEFDNVEDMDEFMIQQWNSLVKDGDRIYHLGDVAWDSIKFDTQIAPRLRGSKRMLLGNHDDAKDVRITQHFKKVTLWRLFKDEGFLCTHLPTREDSIRHAVLNVHGHTHEKVIDDPRYLNVGVERNNYKPFHMDEAKVYAQKAREYCEEHNVGPAFH